MLGLNRPRPNINILESSFKFEKRDVISHLELEGEILRSTSSKNKLVKAFDYKAKVEKKPFEQRPKVQCSIL